MDGTGPHNFTFNESISFIVNCKDQKEIDYFWEALCEGGQESVCGWLKDKFGISWQIVPEILIEIMRDKNIKKQENAMKAVMQMTKFDLEKLKRAYEGSLFA